MQPGTKWGRVGPLRVVSNCGLGEGRGWYLPREERGWERVKAGTGRTKATKGVKRTQMKEHQNLVFSAIGAR